MQFSKKLSWRVLFFLIGFGILTIIFYNPLTGWFQNCMKGDENNVKGYFKTVFSPYERSLFFDTLDAFDKAMKKFNITYFVIGGTLLGTYRHHDLIPWDDDADVIISWSDSYKVFQALDQYDPERFGLYAGIGVSLSSTFLEAFSSDRKRDASFRFASKKFQWKFYPRSGKKVLIWPYTFPYVDIFFYEENATHLVMTSTYFSEAYARKSVFPLVHRPFGDLLVPTPCNVGNLLRSINMDVDRCISRSYDHTIDIPLFSSVINIPCEILSETVPIVNRTIVYHSRFNSHNNITHILKKKRHRLNHVRERLVLNGQILKEFLTSTC